MARYTDESRERVRDAVDFAELVGARTELKRSGVERLQGLCPFHEERTPSFGINPTEKVYYCFGCSAGGDVFRFVMETEGLDFGSALESLAERYNVQLERETEDPGEAARRERRERLYAVLERTAAYYVRVLWESPEAAFAREYLAQRGLREDVLRAYRVGYAPDAFDRVLLGSQRAGYSTDELLAAGLVQTSRGSAGYIDRFRGRVTFPLTDVKGHVLGFGARAMKPDQQPKYLNTSDSEIFHKSQVVYGQDLARAAAAKAGRVVIVEGYTDVIALHQAGVPETVAQMGTALTEAQINAVAKLAPKALFCQDPDRAGQESVARGIVALRGVNAERTSRGVEFRIVRLPAKQDPADVVQQQGADAMRGLLDKAVEIERFEVERALEQPGASREDMLAVATPILASLPASVLRDDLIKLVSNRLDIGVQVVTEVVRDASVVAAPAPDPGWNGGERPWNGGGRGGRRDSGPWRGGGRDRYRPPPPPPEPVDPRAALVRQERTEEAYLSYCIAMPEEGEARLETVDIDGYFSSLATRKAAAHLRGRLRSPNANLPQGDEDLARLVAKLTVEASRLEATPAKLELEALQLDLHRLDRLIAQARLSGDTSGVGALAAERLGVHEAIRHRLT